MITETGSDVLDDEAGGERAATRPSELHQAHPDYPDTASVDIDKTAEGVVLLPVVSHNWIDDTVT